MIERGKDDGKQEKEKGNHLEVKDMLVPISHLLMWESVVVSMDM